MLDGERYSENIKRMDKVGGLGLAKSFPMPNACASHIEYDFLTCLHNTVRVSEYSNQYTVACGVVLLLASWRSLRAHITLYLISESCDVRSANGTQRRQKSVHHMSVYRTNCGRVMRAPPRAARNRLGMAAALAIARHAALARRQARALTGCLGMGLGLWPLRSWVHRTRGCIRRE